MSIRFYISIFVLGCSFLSCVKQEDGPVETKLSVGGIVGDRIKVDADFAGSSKFTVESNVPWSAVAESASCGYLDIVPAYGEGGSISEVAVVIKSRNIGDSRQGKVTITAKDKTYSFKVTQNGYDPVDFGFDDPESVTDGHPFLLASGAEFTKMRKMAATVEIARVMHDYIMRFADVVLETDPVSYEVKGSRMLTISAEAFKRLYYLSYAYRITGDKKYAKRAEEEMLAISDFPDWHEAHFLDTSELMLGVAIAFDWCYPRLQTTSRTKILDALKTKGVEKYFDWGGAVNNWNQVCNSGAIYAASVLAATEPKLYADVEKRAVEMLPLAMVGYNPDGTYIEGPGYWCYGTSYNCLFLDFLQRKYGNTRGLLESFPSFLKTADYANAVVTPSYRVFTYSDQAFPAQISIVPFYIYDLIGNSGVLSLQKMMLEKSMLNLEHFRHERVLPTALVFAARRGLGSIEEVQLPKYYVGAGTTPLASLRGESYLGMKLGTPKANHGHMDIGTFCFESDGVQWSNDMGGEVYENLESAGVDLWNMSQGSERWTVMRCAPYGHSIPILNGAEQLVDERADFIYADTTDTESMSVTADLTKLYSGIDRYSRTIRLVGGVCGEVTDSVKVGENPVSLRWNMVSEANRMQFDAKGANLFSSTGKALRLNVEGIDGFTMEQWSSKPSRSCEAGNYQTILGFTAQLNSGTQYVIKVLLIPATK